MTPQLSGAIAYLRISKQEADDERVSLANQERRIRAFAESQQISIDCVVTDNGVSGGVLEREGMDAIRAAMKAKRITTLIVLRTNRLARDVEWAERLLKEVNKANVRLLSVEELIDTKTPHGKLVMRMMSAISTFERERIGANTSRILQAKIAGGMVLGRVPYGKTPAQAIVLAEIRERAQRESLTAIAKDLNARKIATMLKGKWHASTLSRMLAA